MRLLLDTNVLIDYFGRREPHFCDCTRLLTAAWFGDVELWASAKSFTDIFYLLARACGRAELQQSFIRSLSVLKICSIDGRDIEAAAGESWQDFEDCLISRAAEKIGADFILTRDVRGFERSRVRALSPGAFFEWLRNERHLEYMDIDVFGRPLACAVTCEKDAHPIALTDDEVATSRGV